MSSNGKIWQYLNGAKALSAKEALKSKKDRCWLENQRAALIVVASLIATMAFQAGVNPPGGVWQDTVTGDHIAGTAILSYGTAFYRIILFTSTIGRTAIITECYSSPY